MMVSIIEAVRRACGYKFPPLGGLVHRTILGLLPDVANVELFPGVRAELDMRDQTDRTTYWQGSRFEKPSPQILLHWLKSGTRVSAFFDIGSNYGFYSCWVLSACPEIEVFAFEPNPQTFARLEKIRDMNNLTRLHPYNLGFSNEACLLPLHPGQEDSGHSTFGAHPALSKETIATVPVTRFDTWREQNNLPLPAKAEWLAKVDVEGFELRVLTGMEASLKAKAFKGLIVEVNEFTLRFCRTKPADLFAFLRDCGYASRDRGPADKHFATGEIGNAFFQPIEG